MYSYPRNDDWSSGSGPSRPPRGGSGPPRDGRYDEDRYYGVEENSDPETDDYRRPASLSRRPRSPESQTGTLTASMNSLNFSEPSPGWSSSAYPPYPSTTTVVPPYDPRYYQASPYGAVPPPPQPFPPPPAQGSRRPATTGNAGPKLERAHNQLQEKCFALEKDNEELRAYIATMRSAQGPIHDDGYYVQGIERLNYQVQSWVVKITKSVPDTRLSYNTQDRIMKALEDLGDNGEETVDMLKSGKTSLQRLYEQPRTRIALVRHVIALFFYDRIFYPFAFGLEEEQSDQLRNIEDGIFSQEGEMAKILSIRQAIGRALLPTLEVRKVRAYRAKRVVEPLCEILSLLLPTAPQLRSDVERFTDRAIDLKNAMTEEQALFRWFASTDLDGEELEENCFNVAEEGWQGSPIMCTFPGFGRDLKTDGNKQFVCVVQASAEKWNVERGYGY